MAREHSTDAPASSSVRSDITPTARSETAEHVSVALAGLRAISITARRLLVGGEDEEDVISAAHMIHHEAERLCDLLDQPPSAERQAAAHAKCVADGAYAEPPEVVEAVRRSVERGDDIGATVDFAREAAEKTIHAIQDGLMAIENAADAIDQQAENALTDSQMQGMGALIKREADRLWLAVGELGERLRGAQA